MGSGGVGSGREERGVIAAPAPARGSRRLPESTLCSDRRGREAPSASVWSVRRKGVPNHSSSRL